MSTILTNPETTHTSDDESLFTVSACQLDVTPDRDLDSGLSDTPASVSEGEEPPCQSSRIINERTCLTLEHPLASRWSLYFRANKDKSASWNELIGQQPKVATIGSVEQFWQVFNHLIVPSRMKKRISPNLIFFREGVQPSWEDPENQGGGMWGLVLKEQKGLQRGRLLDQIWFETLLACIGETLTYGDLVTGVVVQRRCKEDRLQLWTKAASDSELTALGAHFKSLLSLDSEVEICYTKHADMSAVSWAARKEQQSISHGNKLDRIDRLKI